MSSEMKKVSLEKVSPGARHELKEGGDRLAHTTHAAVGFMLDSLRKQYPEIDTQLTAGNFIATAQAHTDNLNQHQQSPAAVEYDHEFAEGMRPGVLWDGSRAPEADRTNQQAGAMVMTQEAEQPAPGGYIDLDQGTVTPLSRHEQYIDGVTAEQPSAADTQAMVDRVNAMSGQQVDDNLSQLEQTTWGDPAAQQAMLADSQDLVAAAYGQGGRR